MANCVHSISPQQLTVWNIDRLVTQPLHVLRQGPTLFLPSSLQGYNFSTGDAICSFQLHMSNSLGLGVG